MNILSKAVATITSDDEKDYGPNGGFTAVLSTPSMDRDGDSLKRHEWIEPLPESVPLDVDHGMTVATTVGSFRPYFDGEKMMMEAHFSSLKQAQDARTLIDEGHIRTVSVAFMNDKKALKDGKPHRELLNAGIVAIPSNRDAVITHSKALDTRAAELAAEKLDIEPGTGTILDGILKTVEDTASVIVKVIPEIDHEAMKRVTAEVLAKAGAGNGDMALLQAIHDAAVHLGAVCAACEELHASDVPAQPAPAAKPAAPAKDVDEEEVETKTAALAEPETVEFTNAAGETMTFESREAAREYFSNQLDSIIAAQENTETSSQEAGTPQEETAESPAEEEPAPAAEAAAASEDAAEDAPESEVAVDEQDLFLEFGDMIAFALTSGSSD